MPRGTKAKKARTEGGRPRPAFCAGRAFVLFRWQQSQRPRWWDWTEIALADDVASHCKQRKYRESWASAFLRHPSQAATSFELGGFRFSERALRQYGIDPEAFRSAADGMPQAVVHAAWQLVHVGSVHIAGSHQLPIPNSNPQQTFAQQLATLLESLDVEWRDCGAVPMPETLQPEATAEEEEEEPANKGDEQLDEESRGPFELDASLAPELLPGVPKDAAGLAAFLKQKLRLPANYNVKGKVLEPIRKEAPDAPLPVVLERAARRIAFIYRRGLRLCESLLAPKTPLEEVRRRLGVPQGHQAGEQLASIVHEHGAILVGLLVPGLRHPRPHVIVTASSNPKAGQAVYNWSDLGFEPEEALAFYSGQLLDEKPDDSATGLYQLEAAPGSLVSTLKRSVWVRGDRPPQPAAQQRKLFGGKLLMDPRHWQWPGAWAHVVNASLRADLANLVVHESLVMAALPGAAFGRFSEGLWWYGPAYW